MSESQPKRLCYFLRREDQQDMFCGSNIDGVLNTITGEMRHEFDTQRGRAHADATVFTLIPMFMTDQEIESMPDWDG